MNKIILKGNIVRDPEVKTIETNDQRSIMVTNFTVAVSRFFKKNNGEKDKDTTFVPCEAWDSGAEFIGNYFKKGDPILLEGSLKTESWENSEGQQRSRMKVRVSHFEKLYRAPPQPEKDENVG